VDGAERRWELPDRRQRDVLCRKGSAHTQSVVATANNNCSNRLPSFCRCHNTQHNCSDRLLAFSDFYDPVNDRRILWGWAQIPNGAQALPRHVTWHPELEQLVFSPLAEQAALRVSPPLLAKQQLAVMAGGVVTPLGEFGAKAAQAEVFAVFQTPKVAAVFGVAISANWEAYVAFTPPSAGAGASGASWTVQAGLRSPIKAGGGNGSGVVGLARYMPETDFNGGDYNKNATVGRHHPPGTDPNVCQAECDKAEECVAWTYVIRGAPAGSGDCCLKKHGATGPEAKLSLCPKMNAKLCTSGVKTPQKAPRGCGSGGDGGAGPAYTQALALLLTDAEIEIRVFTDHTILEVFFMDGRVAVTAPLVPAEDVGFGVFSEHEAVTVEVGAWGVSEIWITPEQVIAGSV
jgi:hypothetical protein